MARAVRYTSVPVRASTLQALQPYRIGGKSYDDVIQEFIEADPPQSFWKELQRRTQRPELSLEEVRKRLGL